MNPSQRAPAHRNFRADPQDRIVAQSVKARRQIVAVIADPTALIKALRLHKSPDFFELRLDALRNHLGEIERAIPKLRAPLIFTARHPLEGGYGRLSVMTRRDLLRRFLDHAAVIDLELRSVSRMRSLIEAIHRKKIPLLISRHELHATPSRDRMQEQLKAAISAGADIFKLATRTDTTAQLARLLDFFTEHSGDFPIAAMGMGRLGAESRRRLWQLGSILNYTALMAANTPGQLSLRQLRRISRAYII